MNALKWNLKHITLLGLRCQASDMCSSWRWTTPEANLSGPTMHCEVTNGCKPRRCVLLREVLEAYSQPGSTDYISGDKSCYKQQLGQLDSCYERDHKFTFDKVYLSEDKACAFQIENTKAKNWGECAQKTKNRTWSYWSWASSACSNCNPGSCFLFKIGNSTGKCPAPGDVPNLIYAPGFISGDWACTDISYIERNISKVVPVPGAEDGEWFEGKCKVKGGKEPDCPPQEVPGFRWIQCLPTKNIHIFGKVPSNILIFFRGGSRQIISSLCRESTFPATLGRILP